MELWIRSQDKSTLVKVDDIYYEGSFIYVNQERQYRYEGLKVGSYTTKERALEVLDEIQEYINNNCEFIEIKTHTKMGTYTAKIETNVYEMPKD